MPTVNVPPAPGVQINASKITLNLVQGNAADVDATQGQHSQSYHLTQAQPQAVVHTDEQGAVIVELPAQFGNPRVTATW